MHSCRDKRISYVFAKEKELPHLSKRQRGVSAVSAHRQPQAAVARSVLYSAAARRSSARPSPASTATITAHQAWSMDDKRPPSPSTLNCTSQQKDTSSQPLRMNLPDLGDRPTFSTISPPHAALRPLFHPQCTAKKGKHCHTFSLRRLPSLAALKTPFLNSMFYSSVSKTLEEDEAQEHIPTQHSPTAD